MPVSKREMDELMGGGMGMAYVPGTFPTLGVYTLMKRSGIDTSYSEVDRLWDAYYIVTVNQGVPAFNPAGGGKNAAPLLTEMGKLTSIPKGTIAAWLNALYEEVKANGRAYYLDPATAEKAAVGQVDPINHPLETVKTVLQKGGEAAGAFLKPVSDPVINILKYASIGVVGVAVIYGIYQFTPIFKASRRRKKKGA